MLKQVYNLKFTCDVCKIVKHLESETKSGRECPNRWKTIHYSMEGGGHYGLPHHHHELHVCDTCLSNSSKDELKKKLVPKDAFDIYF